MRFPTFLRAMLLVVLVVFVAVWAGSGRLLTACLVAGALAAALQVIYFCAVLFAVWRSGPATSEAAAARDEVTPGKHGPHADASSPFAR